MSVSVIAYKVRRLADNELAKLKGTHVDELDTACTDGECEYKAYPAEDVEKHPERFAEIMAYVKPVEMRRTVVDHKQCYIDNGLPADAKYYSSSYRSWGIVIQFDGKSISIPRENLDHYSREETGTYYVYKREYVDADVSDWCARMLMEELSKALNVDLSYHPHHMTKKTVEIISKVLIKEYDEGSLYSSEELLAFMVQMMKVNVGVDKKVFLEFQD